MKNDDCVGWAEAYAAVYSAKDLTELGKAVDALGEIYSPSPSVPPTPTIKAQNPKRGWIIFFACWALA